MIKLSVQFERFWNELKSKMGIAHGFASLDAEGRIPYSQLPESAMEYKGKWDAETNTPDLNQTSLKVNGSFYIVSVPGTFEGVEYRENDRIVYDGEEGEWQRLPAGAVSSVNGMTGPVVLTAEDIRMSGMDDATVYDNLMKMIAATGNVAYKTYPTYAQMMAGEDFAQLPNGIYIYVVAQDENYPRLDQPGYFYTTIYSYLAYRDESTAGITDWDSYEWNTETVQKQSEMDGEYFMAGNLATGTTATASTGNASLAVDGNLETRWESAQEDPQWIAVDLGKKQIVESIGFLWETASAAEYEIQFSNDGEEWTTVQKCSGSTINVKEYRKITLQNPSLVRHVRMFGNTRTTPYGYSIYELGVYGKGSSGNLQLVGKLATNFVNMGKVLSPGYATEDKSYYPIMVGAMGAPDVRVYDNGTLSFNPFSRTLTIAGDGGNVANHSSHSSTYFTRVGSGVESATISGNGVNKVTNDVKQELFDSVHPIGEVYVQYQGTSKPEDLYNKNGITSTWTEITSNYDGGFFRAYKSGSSGGFSESSVTKQAEGLPNITGSAAGIATGSGFSGTGAFSESTKGSSFETWGSSSGNRSTFNFSAANGNSTTPWGGSSGQKIYGNNSHVTPYNSAIKIWKRTA